MGLTVGSTSRHTLQLRGTNMDLTDMSQETAQRIWDASTPVQKEDGQFYCKHEGCTFRHEYACNTAARAMVHTQRKSVAIETCQGGCLVRVGHRKEAASEARSADSESTAIA